MKPCVSPYILEPQLHRDYLSRNKIHQTWKRPHSEALYMQLLNDFVPKNVTIFDTRQDAFRISRHKILKAPLSRKLWPYRTNNKQLFCPLTMITRSFRLQIAEKKGGGDALQGTPSAHGGGLG